MLNGLSREEEKQEENNETPQTPENNDGANVDNGTPPKKEEIPVQDNGASGEISDDGGEEVEY